MFLLCLSHFDGAPSKSLPGWQDYFLTGTPEHTELLKDTVDFSQYKSDSPSRRARGRRTHLMISPVIIPESDDEGSDEDNVPLSNFANNEKKIGRNRKDPTEKIRCELNQLDPYNIENYIFTGAIILTSYFWGWLADTKGRRPAMMVAMFISVIVSVASSFAPNLASFAVLQFVSAIFMTGPSAVVYTYLGEFNNLRNRDKMVTCGSSFIGIGTVVLPCFAWLILPLDFSYRIDFLDISYCPWRLLIVASTIPFSLASLFLFLAPESPKFLYANGRYEEALEVVKMIYALNTFKNKDSFPVKSLIVESQVTKLNSATGITAIFASMKEQTLPIFQRPLLPWICLTCFVQFGIFAATNGFYIWFPTILNALASEDSADMKICDVIELTRNKAAADALNSTSIICDDTIYTSTFERSIYVGLVFYSMYIIVAVLVDFVGKKLILVVTLCITGMCAVAANLTYNQQVAVVLFAIFQMSGACIGLTNAVAVELFPTKYRAMAICLSMMLGRTGSMVGSNLIGWFLDVNCGAGFYVFGILLVLNGLSCITLPNMKKEKPSETGIAVTGQTQIQEP